MDEPGTVFCLVPTTGRSFEIVQDGVNDLLRRNNPRDPHTPFLRIGLNQPSKTPGCLAKFGRASTNDVILGGGGWSKHDQCYFDFHPTTGELLLHDLSPRGNTRLYDHNDNDQMWKTPRQCVVLLDRTWDFSIGNARFRLIPQATHDSKVFREEGLSFARQLLPTEYQGTYQSALKRLSDFGSQSLVSSHHEMQQNNLHEPEPSMEIRSAVIDELGGGAQGQVHEVVDTHTGEHYARKIVQFQPIPRWRIFTKESFKARVLKEVSLLKTLRHDHIVPYLYTQGWGIEQEIELFMPLYEGHLMEKICGLESQTQRHDLIGKMTQQISLALHYVHTRNPPILHRDIKPQNILYKGESFYLADFGISKTVDASRTYMGTQIYMPPEIWLALEQTTKVDIYSFGVTILDCLEKFKISTLLPASWQPFQDDLRLRAGRYNIASMLASDPTQRPAASQILHDLFRECPDPPIPGFQFAVTQSDSFSSSISTPPEESPTIYSRVFTAMDWTLTEPAKSLDEISHLSVQTDVAQRSLPSIVIQGILPEDEANGLTREDQAIPMKSTKSKSPNKRQHGRNQARNGQARNGPSGSQRITRSQSAKISKRTRQINLRRPKSKAALAMIQNMVDTVYDANPQILGLA